MESFIISGGNSLNGEVEISGSKNVALKAIVAGLLTDGELIIENAPAISDLTLMEEIAQKVGVKIERSPRVLKIKAADLQTTKVPLEMGARLRSSSMFIAPLLARLGHAVIPNPGGCRIGARPIDRHMEGLIALGAKITYGDDGYFRASAKKLIGTTYKFGKNTHTGTETLILAATLAQGKTILENSAQEPEVDDLIALLNRMGAKIKRTDGRQITIEGVKSLSGATYKIMADRNEAVTFAIAALVTQGDVFVRTAKAEFLQPFLEKLNEAGGGWEQQDSGIRFFWKKPLKATNVTTASYPGFMTDWQAPWVILATQSEGDSVIHETVYENRFQYVHELQKMGAKIELFNPEIAEPENFYNFNWADNRPEYFHAALVSGPILLHNGVLEISDLRAGATLVLAALAASGESYLSGIEHIDRGYEDFEKRLKALGAKIKRVEKE